jgi:hypothetical protein
MSLTLESPHQSSSLVEFARAHDPRTDRRLYRHLMSTSAQEDLSSYRNSSLDAASGVALRGCESQAA